MNDKETAGICESVTTGVALICRAAADKVGKGAPAISVCASGALGALVGIEAMAFGRAPTGVVEQDAFHLMGCLLLSRMCTAVAQKGNLMGTEVAFEPSKLLEAMDDYEKLTGRKFDQQLFKSIWRDALAEESKGLDGLKSQFGQFFPQ